ncbi:response regulator [Flavisolibacter nicotianae]|uniref:response regulator n=1 Tax=Flavisolibacter nicotianae TaxID=2364882 RepID=UPI000EB3D9D7|nr:response regulator [Flavisolibacter nicotianae]
MRICKKVMLVDDDRDDLELVLDALSTIGIDHTIVLADNGKDGLKKLQNMQNTGELPCLIVLDVNMPKMDGKQTIVALKADPNLAKIPVVIFSTSSSKLDKMFFEQYGAPYFVKPVNFQFLVETVTRMITLCLHQNN